jgi:hypothetical protein
MSISLFDFISVFVFLLMPFLICSLWNSCLLQLRLRHECKSKYITKVNEKLTELQRSQIQKTPFKWLLSLPKKFKISENLLEELVERWDGRSGGFAIQGRIIRFTPLDVCFALGLRIIGEKVNFKKDPTSTTKAMFDNEVINVKTIYAKIINMEGDEDVENFCRLYLLLGFAEFYFPNSTDKVSGWCLKMLDDLNSIGRYNWGVAVYETLACSLNRVAPLFCEGKNTSRLQIKGCALVLQVCYRMIFLYVYRPVFVIIYVRVEYYIYVKYEI